MGTFFLITVGLSILAAVGVLGIMFEDDYDPDDPRGILGIFADLGAIIGIIANMVMSWSDVGIIPMLLGLVLFLAVGSSPLWIKHIIENELHRKLYEYGYKREQEMELWLYRTWRAFLLRDKAALFRMERYSAEIQASLPDKGYDAERLMVENVREQVIKPTLQRRAAIRRDIRRCKRDLRRYRRYKDKKAHMITEARETLASLRNLERECTEVIERSLRWLDLVEQPLAKSKYVDSVDMSSFTAEYDSLTGFAERTQKIHVPSPAIRDILRDALDDEATQAEMAALDVDARVERVRTAAAEREGEPNEHKQAGMRAKAAGKAVR